MRYSVEIKKFLYSQYFYGGLRIAVGISLPAVLMLVIFDNRELGFTISTGALSVCTVDMPGPLKYKHNEMLTCSLLGFLVAIMAGIATANPATLWLTVVALTFVLSMLVVYGFKWPQISFAALFIMAVTFGKHFTPSEALINAAWIGVGGLWYTYWSTLVSGWQSHRLEQQAIAESVFATAEYLRARANFYELENELDECYRQLVTKQITAVDLQDAARDIVLRNLPNLRAGKLDGQRTMLFNLFINIVDLHEMVVAAHTDYVLLRSTFGGSDVMIFFRDLLRKIAHDLETVGLAVLQDQPLQPQARIKAELRAIEYEIEVMRKKHLPDKHPEAYAALVATCRRVWSLSRLIDRMRSNTRMEKSSLKTEINLDQMLQDFLQHRKVSMAQIFSNLTLTSPSFRHALRVTAAVAFGFWLGKLLPLTNSYWICLTSIVILKPGFSLTKQRNMHRLIGTGIGCALSVVLITFVKSPHTLLLIMFTCMVMSYSLLLFNYPASVVFTSSYVLILYHLLAPESMRLIGERALDTAIGGAIAVAMSYLFPYWEYRFMGPLVKNVIGSIREYFEAVRSINEKLANNARAWLNSAVSKASVSSLLAERDLRYRLARKNMHIAFANLGNAFSRMILEPKSQQKFVAELNDLLIQSHVLAAQITSAAPLIAAIESTNKPALAHALTVIDSNLAQAEASASIPDKPQAGEVDNHANDTPQPERIEADADTHTSSSERLDMIKALSHELDSMVVNAQQTEAVPAEMVQDLKLLAHQCKQMITVSQLIVKDASVIRLPAN